MNTRFTTVRLLSLATFALAAVVSTNIFSARPAFAACVLWCDEDPSVCIGKNGCLGTPGNHCIKYSNVGVGGQWNDCPGHDRDVTICYFTGSFGCPSSDYPDHCNCQLSAREAEKIVAHGNVDSLRQFLSSHKDVKVNSSRGSLQVLACDGKEVIANIPLPAAMLKGL